MINLELMEDLLHPTKVGHEAMARCLLRRAQQVTEYIAANHVEVRFAAWEACSQPCGGGWQSREWQCIVGADFLLGLNSDLQREASSTVCSSVKVGDAQLSRICNTETCRPATQVTSRVEHDREQPGQQDPPPESQQPTNRRDGPLAPASPVQQPKQPSLPKQTDNSSRSVPVPKTEQLPPPFESVEQQQQELTRPQDTSPRPRGSAPLTQPPPIRVIEPSETTDAGSSQVADRQKQESMTPAAAREVVPSSDKTSDFPNEDTARETSMRQSTGSNIPSLQPGPPSNVAQPVEPGGRSAQEKHKRTDASPSVDEDEAIDPSAIEALPMTAEEQLPGQDEVHVPEYSMFEGVDGARNEDVRSSQEKHKRTGASPSVDEDEAIDPSANEASPMMAEEQLPGQDEVHVPEYSLLEGVDGARNEAVGETGEHSGSEEESRPPRKAVDSRPLADSQFPSMTTAADASISADRPLAFAVWILIGVLFVTALVSLAGLLYYILNNRRVGVRQYPANKRGAPTEKDNDVQEQVQKGVFDLSTMTREAEFSGDLVRDSIVAVRDSFDCYMLPMPPRTSLSASFHPMILRASFQEHP